MKTIYREKRYYCGEYLDVYIFPTYRQSNGRRSRSKPTTAAQKKLNQRHREEKLVRLPEMRPSRVFGSGSIRFFDAFQAFLPTGFLTM
jgi:hypothetical protein